MAPPGRAVRIKETGEVFKSARQCAKAIGGNHANIWHCLNGAHQRRSHKGYRFEYVVWVFNQWVPLTQMMENYGDKSTNTSTESIGELT